MSLGTQVDIQRRCAEQKELFADLNKWFKDLDRKKKSKDACDPLDEVRRLKEKGDLSAKGKDWENAEELYSKALNVLSESSIMEKDLTVSLLNNRALCYLNVGKFLLCISDCKRVLENVMSAKAFYRMGCAQLNLHDWFSAKESLTKSLNCINPSDDEYRVVTERLASLEIAKARAAEVVRDKARWIVCNTIPNWCLHLEREPLVPLPITSAHKSERPNPTVRCPVIVEQTERYIPRCMRLKPSNP